MDWNSAKTSNLNDYKLSNASEVTCIENNYKGTIAVTHTGDLVCHTGTAWTTIGPFTDNLASIRSVSGPGKLTHYPIQAETITEYISPNVKFNNYSVHFFKIIEMTSDDWKCLHKHKHNLIKV